MKAGLNGAPKHEVSLRLSYLTSSSIVPVSLEPEDLILNIKADIIARSCEVDNPEAVNIGKLECYLIRLGEAVNQGFGFYDIFDSLQETMDMAEALYNASLSKFKPAVTRRFSEARPWDDILLLHRLEIHPLARGQRIGLAVLGRAILDWSSGCSLVVMKPFPLQFEVNAAQRPAWNELELSKFSSDEKKAFTRLIKYYEQLGFERIGKTQFFALSPATIRPSAEEVGISNSFSIPAELMTRNV